MPTREPTVAIVAPVTVDALQAVLASHGDPMPGAVVVAGAGEYSAIADYAPGPPHGPAEENLARELSRTAAGPCFVLSFDDDPPRVTSFEAGELVTDGGGDPIAIVHAHGLGALLPADRPEPRSFVFVPGASVADVAGALGVPVPGPSSRLHLELRAGGVLGWTDGEQLGALAARLSRRLGTRVYGIRDAPGSFHVRELVAGKETAVLEQPPTALSADKRVDELLGAASRDGILRAIGAPRR
jgi:hypothetical protein